MRSAFDTLSLVLCRVTTTSGLVGYGECLCNRPPMQQALVATIRDAIAPVYLDRPVAATQTLNLAVRRRYASFGRAGTVLNALAAIDIALWDIAGKAAGKSVSEMLGGAKRKQLQVMASLNKYDDGPRVRARLEEALAAGVRAAKVHESSLAVIEEARRTIPADVPFVADCNNAHTLADVRRDEARWRDLDLLWFEDPYWPPEDLLSCPELPGIVIGMGADFGSAEQMALYTQAPSVGVLQPRRLHAGRPLGGEPCPGHARGGEDDGGTSHAFRRGRRRSPRCNMLAVTPQPGYFATIEATDAMDMYGTGLARWQATIDVPTGPGLGYDPDPAFLRAYDCARDH